MITRQQLPRPVKLTPDIRRALVALVLTAFITSCSDDIQSGDREEQNPPPETAGGFVGYSSSGDKLTSCGVCHVNRNGNWSGTAHADAYATLEESGSARDFCYGCHTVSENGNAAEGPAGWNAVQHAAYHDVQCESCHGPGSDHIEVPDGVWARKISVEYGMTMPLAKFESAKVDVGVTEPISDGETIEAAISRAQEWVLIRVDTKVKRIRGGDQKADVGF